MAKKYGGMFNIFVEKVAREKNSMNGKYFSGVPIYRGQSDCKGKPLADSQHYPFNLITYKEPFGGHSRTISNYWTNIGMQPENHIVINRRDAERLGLKPNQLVRIVSAANPEGVLDLLNGRRIDLVGRLQVVEGMRPGVVGVSWHYGHWAYGASDVWVDGKRIKGDRRRAAGLCPNPVMALDPVLRDVCLTDPIGGSASFYDSYVALQPA